MKAHYYCLWAIGIFLLGSCATNTTKWNDIQIVNVEAAATNKEKVAEKVRKVDDTTELRATIPYDIKVNMDFMDGETEKNAEACKNINTQLIKEFLDQRDEEDVNKAVNVFIERLANQMEIEEDVPEMYDHYTGKATFGKDGIVNYSLTEDYYGGGAHPTTTVTILRFNSESGRMINLEDVFVDSCMNTLNERLTKKLMDHVGVTSLDSLHSLGYLDLIDMFATDNFELEHDSISFHYNQYDIAPYAVGQTTLKFSYDELKDLMHK